MGRKSVTKPRPSADRKPSLATKQGKKPDKSLSQTEPASEPEADKLAEDDSDGDSEDDSEEDIDEEGMQNLMAALKRQGVELPSGDEDEEDEEGEEGEDSADEEDQGEQDEPVGKTGKTDDGAAEAPRPHNTLAESILRSGLVPTGGDEDEEQGDDVDEQSADSSGDDEEQEVELDQVTGELPAAVLATKRNRVRINNTAALKALTESIALNGPSKGANLAWTETMDIRWSETVTEEVGDAIEDDLKRELVFYRQALTGAEEGRRRLAQAGVPFIRPKDYFAEMVKSDEHMERVRQRMLDERAGIKASEEAKRQRELKKFGKKVQVEKQLERQKQKRDFADKVKDLKRKHQGADDEFDVQLADAMEEARAARGGPSERGRGGKARMPRSARDAKYGYGGKKKHSKANTRESTENFSFGGGRGGGPAGKKRRISGTAGVRAPANKKSRPGKNARAGRR